MNTKILIFDHLVGIFGICGIPLVVVGTILRGAWKRSGETDARRNRTIVADTIFLSWMLVLAVKFLLKGERGIFIRFEDATDLIWPILMFVFLMNFKYSSYLVRRRK